MPELETAPARGQADKARERAEKKIGTTIAGRYQLEALLGFGGMGAVYRAVQEPLGRKVALKCIRSVLTDDELAVKRFIQEARAISQLQHPNIVTLHDFGQDEDGTLFIAMELLEGCSLREHIEAQGPLSAAESVDVVRGITRALAQAHASGIIHRDLKPDNVMLIDVKGHGRTVKVVDFGVAKLGQTDLSEGPLTGTGHVVGTPGYIAPEQMDGALDEPRSDLYALGVVWFEALTGTSPFDGETPMKRAFQHLTEEPPRPSERLPTGSIPAPVEDLVLRLLEKKPADRPPSAEALLELLDRLDEAGLKVRAGSPSALAPALPTAGLTTPPTPAESGLPAELDDDDEEAVPVAARPFIVNLLGLLLLGLAVGFLTIYLLLDNSGAP